MGSRTNLLKYFKILLLFYKYELYIFIQTIFIVYRWQLFYKYEIYIFIQNSIGSYLKNYLPV